MKRDSFIFYKSFYESIKELDTEHQAEIYNAIFQYQFEGIEPDLKGISKSLFTLIIPQLKANNKKYENGKLGGRPRNNQSETKEEPKQNLKITKTKPKNNQSETKVKPNDNDNVNENDNENVNVNDNDNELIKHIEEEYSRTLSNIEKKKINDWLLWFEEKEVIKEAFDISVLNDKKNLNYVQGILTNWKNQKVKKIKDINKKSQESTEESFDYDWLGGQ